MPPVKDGMKYIDQDPELAALLDVEPDPTHVLLEWAPRPKRRTSRWPRVELTDENVRAAQSSSRESWVIDAIDTSLWLRVRPTGGKSFYFVHRSPRRRRRSDPEDWCEEVQPRTKFLGSASDYTVDEARIKAGWTARQFDEEKPLKMPRDVPVAKAVSEYLKRHPRGGSEWSRTVATLFTKHLLSRFGTSALSGIKKDQWLLLIEKTAAAQRSQGENLLKATRPFLFWAVERGLIEANPLARFKRLNLPPTRRSFQLRLPHIASIFEAAQELGHPWAAIVGLAIITGETVESVRGIEGHEIDFERGIWTKPRATKGCERWEIVSPARSVHLTGEALNLLSPYRNAKGYLFPSPRATYDENKPINLHAHIIELIKTKSGVESEWGIRDLRREVRSHIESFGGGTAGLQAWSTRFAAERAARHAIDEEVVL